MEALITSSDGQVGLFPAERVRDKASHDNFVRKESLLLSSSSMNLNMIQIRKEAYRMCSKKTDDWMLDVVLLSTGEMIGITGFQTETSEEKHRGGITDKANEMVWTVLLSDIFQKQQGICEQIFDMCLEIQKKKSPSFRYIIAYCKSDDRKMVLFLEKAGFLFLEKAAGTYADDFNECSKYRKEVKKLIGPILREVSSCNSFENDISLLSSSSLTNIDTLSLDNKGSIVSFLSSESKSNVKLLNKEFASLVRQLSTSLSFRMKRETDQKEEQLDHLPRLGSTIVWLKMSLFSQKQTSSTSWGHGKDTRMPPSIATRVGGAKESGGDDGADSFTTTIKAGNTGGGAAVSSSGGGEQVQTTDGVESSEKEEENMVIGIVIERNVSTLSYVVKLLYPISINNDKTKRLYFVSHVKFSDMYKVPRQLLSTLNLDHFQRVLSKDQKNYITKSTPLSIVSQDVYLNGDREVLPMKLLLGYMKQRPQLKSLSLSSLDHCLNDNQLLAFCGSVEACREYEIREVLVNNHLELVDCSGSKVSWKALEKAQELLSSRAMQRQTIENIPDNLTSKNEVVVVKDDVTIIGKGGLHVGIAGADVGDGSRDKISDNGQADSESVYKLSNLKYKRCWMAAYPDVCWSARDVVEMQLRCFQEAAEKSNQGIIIAHRFASLKNRMYITSTETFIRMMKLNYSIMLQSCAYEAYHIISFEEDNFTAHHSELEHVGNKSDHVRSLYLVRVCKGNQVGYFVWDLERDMSTDSRYFRAWFTNSVSAYQLTESVLYNGTQETPETAPFIVSTLQRIYSVDDAEY